MDVYCKLSRQAVVGALLMVPLLLGGCGEPNRIGSSQWAGTVDTLGSGRLVVTSPDAAIWTQPPILQERFRVGTLDAEGAELFGRIGGLELGPDGSVYVLDDQANEVRVFGVDGSFLRAFGREGEGPGELRSPSGLAFDEEGWLWLLNWRNGRYTAFDPATGQAVREPRRQAAFGSFPWRGAFLQGGFLVDVALDHDGEPALLRLDTLFVPTDTLSLPQPAPDSRVVFRRGGVMVASLSEPFAPYPTWAPRPRGGVVFGEGSEYRLHRVDFGGDTTMTMVLVREPAPVSGAERDSAMAAFRRMSEAYSSADPEREPRTRSTKPLHGMLFVDDQDRTWVRGVGVEGVEPSWDVFGSDGRFLGQVAIPDPVGFVSPVLRRDRMVVATQAAGFPTVVVYDVVESGGG